MGGSRKNRGSEDRSGGHARPLSLERILLVMGRLPWLWSALIPLVYASYVYPPPEYRELDRKDNQYGTPCNGTYIMTAATGTISDGCAPRYNQLMKCFWGVQPSPSIGSIPLTFTRFSLETGYDFV